MSTRIFRILALISLPACLLPGQDSQIAGPVSGYVFDRAARGLRPILGIPGASIIGNPVDFGLEVSAAYVAPRQDAAFVTAADGTFHLFRIGAGKATELILNGLTGAPDRVVFSPSGMAAALYAGGAVQIVNGLPDSPAIAGGLDATAAGLPGSIALSDDGAILLLASGNSVELFGGSGDLGKLTDAASAALVAFAPGRHDAAVVDPTGAGVVLFRNLAAASDSQVVAAPDDTIQSASALAFSADGSRLLLANSASQSVTAFDLTAGGRSAIACSCSPSTLVRVGDLFRLNDLGSEPLWLLDAQPDAPRVLFVPAVSTEIRRQPKGIGFPRRPVVPERPAVQFE